MKSAISFLFVIVFIACQPPQQRSPRILDTVIVSAYLDETGKFVVGHTQEELRLRMAQTIVNCRASHIGIGCDSTLYKKWRNRVTKVNVDSAIFDIQNSTLFETIKNDDYEDVLITQRMKWGSLDEQDGVIIRFTDFTQAKLDSIRNDSLAWKIPIQVLRDSTRLNDFTFRQIGQMVKVPQKIKEKFIELRNKILELTNNEIDILDITPWQLLVSADSRVRHKFIRAWIRFPFFKMSAKWLKRQQ